MSRTRSTSGMVRAFHGKAKTSSHCSRTVAGSGFPKPWSLGASRWFRYARPGAKVAGGPVVACPLRAREPVPLAASSRVPGRRSWRALSRCFRSPRGGAVARCHSVREMQMVRFVSLSALAGGLLVALSTPYCEISRRATPGRRPCRAPATPIADTSCSAMRCPRGSSRRSSSPSRAIERGTEAGVERLRDALAEITVPGPGGSVPAFLPMPDGGGSS